MASIESMGTPASAAPSFRDNGKRALRALVQTDHRLATAVLRIGLGLVMFPHGAQKAIGWFGGGGFAKTMAYFTDVVHLPWIVGLLVIAAEFVGSLMLIAGIFTRFAAVSVGLVMAGAAMLVHAPNGFFMNWFGNQAGEGFEFHLLAIAIAASVVIAGGGRWSLDRKLSRA